MISNTVLVSCGYTEWDKMGGGGGGGGMKEGVRENKWRKSE